MLKTIAAALVALGLLAQAAAAEDLGPAVGTKAPDIGTPLDQTSQPRSLASLFGSKGVVLFFFRSTVW